MMTPTERHLLYSRIEFLERRVELMDRSQFRTTIMVVFLAMMMSVSIIVITISL